MGRLRKYNTDKECKEAKKLADRKYDHSSKWSSLTLWISLVEINLNTGFQKTLIADYIIIVAANSEPCTHAQKLIF